MHRNLFAFVLVVLACCTSCSGGGSSTSSSSSGTVSGNTTLFNAVKATTPTFTATLSAAPALKAEMYSAPTFSDQSMNMAFQLLRNYTFPNDEGKVDMTNIYKVLHETGGYLDNAKSMCSSITTTVDSAVSAYAFSDFLGHTYNCGGTNAESGGYGSSVAYREDTASGDKFMLATYKWAPDPVQQITIGSIQTRFNNTTKDVELTFAQTVNYPVNSAMGGATGNGFATRTNIKGNADTHTFEIKIALVNGFGGMSMVGKGVSQGAGQYFLIRNNANYYCLPAGATEDDLRNISATTQAGVSANCTAYIAGVNGLAAYNVNDTAQIPNINLSDFSNGVAGTPYHYLMFP